MNRAAEWLEEQFEELWSKYGHAHKLGDGTIQFTVAGRRSQGLLMSFKIQSSPSKAMTRHLCSDCGEELYTVAEVLNHEHGHRREWDWREYA